MTNFIFSGLKHSGKSTHGRLFAESRGLVFFDLDDLIEDRFSRDFEERLDCRDIYKKHGEEFFRELEHRTVREFLSDCAKEPFVLALGGGIAFAPAEILDECSVDSVLVYLKVPVDVLIKRILGKGIPPFLSADSPEEDFRKIFEERSAVLEEAATRIIEVPDQDIERIQQIIRADLKEY